MAIEPKDINRLEKKIGQILARRDSESQPLPAELSAELRQVFVDAPHFLLGAGFDNVCFYKTGPDGTAPDVFAWHPLARVCDWTFPSELFVREEGTGAWAWFEGVVSSSEIAHDSSDGVAAAGIHLHFVSD